MIQLFRRMFGSKSQRDVRRLRHLVARINALEAGYQSLSESELRGKTDEFRNRIRSGENVDDVLCEAFAVVKNACRRLAGTRVTVCGHDLVWDMIPFDTQIMGAISLHQGKIAEMATGEGKTLVATMPLYLNALGGKNVHLVTVNDYLARRDAQWMGTVFEYLGVTVGCIQNQMRPDERRIEYGKDITYGTNSEFGFDYLRDNGMAWHPEEQVQRGYHYAIIDEVDSILIDEARTPLIISGPSPVSSAAEYVELKPKVDALVRKQRDLCNRLVQESKELLEKGETEKAQYRLYQVKHGMPKHKQFLHMLEDGATRRLVEQIDNAMLTDMRKEYARTLREELFFTIDERHHDASLTEKGCEAMSPGDPDAYVLPDLVSAISDLEGDPSLSETDRVRRRQEIHAKFTEKSDRIHNVDQLIRAYCLYERDVEYVVQDNQVLIVDEFTGRILPGRRWSDGLHQAVEAKEGVKIERETQTLATITIQNYFRMYTKLAGMTGTAETEANEFRQIYNLDVVVIPTNRPVRRIDFNDVVYKTQREKFNAVIDEIRDCHERGQPVLVGTISVETSELISRMLRRVNIPHNVLNAKNHEREAEIVVNAGQRGAVTIATNMAGRGTDIKLGEGVVTVDRSVIVSSTTLNDKVGGRVLGSILREKPCGLHVIGSERHEARRIDRQLRGRCARQGDPGSSRFYVSLEDDLMRLFGSDRIARFMSRAGIQDGEALEHGMLTRQIERAQRMVEQQNFSIRRRTLEYDDVMNKQRTIVYGLRGEVVRSEKVRDRIFDILFDVIVNKVELLLGDAKNRLLDDFLEWAHTTFPIPLRREDVNALGDDTDKIAEMVFDRVKKSYELKVASENPDTINLMERHLVLNAIDSHWQDYLRSMDSLREGVGLRAYGQQDPLIEYKKEAFHMFGELMDNIKSDIAGAVFRSATSVNAFESFIASLPKTMVHDEVSLLGGGRQSGEEGRPGSRPGPASPPQGMTIRREGEKVGRNDPCPCGSGKKFKKCCGQNA